MKKEGLSQIVIAKNLSRNKSTMRRELKRNKGLRGYRPNQAEEMAKKRELLRPKSKRLDEKIISRYKREKKLHWSAKQISGRMKIDGLISISHETF